MRGGSSPKPSGSGPGPCSVIDEVHRRAAAEKTEGGSPGPSSRRCASSPPFSMSVSTWGWWGSMPTRSTILIPVGPGSIRRRTTITVTTTPPAWSSGAPLRLPPPRLSLQTSEGFLRRRSAGSTRSWRRPVPGFQALSPGHPLPFRESFVDKACTSDAEPVMRPVRSRIVSRF